MPEPESDVATAGGDHPIRQANQRLHVVNGHHLAVVRRNSRTQQPTAYECRGCGRREESKNLSACPRTTIWVQLGAPGDGVGRCRDCEALFVFERPVNPAHEHPCPECGSIQWYRTDETDPDPQEVLTDVAV